MASEKTRVIEHLFFLYWDADGDSLTKTVMTQDDVQKAIEYCNERFGSSLSTRNPANFMKDVVRGQNASKNWPQSLKELCFTAVQRTGTGDVFQFVRYKPGQTEPFPDLYKPTADTLRLKIQSISMSLAAKDLGRSDEPWLIQTAVNLRLVENYFAVVSDLPIVQLSHLQMSVKLRKTEIDAIFLATIESRGKYRKAIVTCEAKQARERLLDDQIINQAIAAFQETDVDVVIPMGLRAVKGVGFYIAEFQSVSRKDAEALTELLLAKDAVFELCPPVPGI